MTKLIFSVLNTAILAWVVVSVSANASDISERVADSAQSSVGPQGREIAIKNVDLVQTRVQNMSYHSETQRLDVYLWIRGLRNPANDQRDNVRVIDAGTAPDPITGARHGIAEWVGQDSAHPEYGVFRYAFYLGRGQTDLGAHFCVDLYAAMHLCSEGACVVRYSNEGTPNDFFRYCH
jgi:hypothetical protein